jgi:hypothetical protein
MTVRMNFGKHKGQRLQDVPTSYLAWVLRECTNLEGWLRAAIGTELGTRDEAPQRTSRRAAKPTRGEYPPPVDWAGILRKWHHGLALDYHPDRGGHPEAMKAINEAHDRLKRLVGV